MTDPTINRRTLLTGALAGAVVGAVGPARGAAVTHKMPTIYLPHGGGPCFFMKEGMGPPGTWDGMAKYLRELVKPLAVQPSAILVVSAHWEEAVPTVLTAPKPPLLYDYYGFPDYTYQLTWPAPGAPVLAARVRQLLTAAGIDSAEDAQRGFDHGVFIPLKLTYPEAQIPTTQLSLVKGLDPQQHLEIGKALAPLRDEGVLIIGSGMSFHNLKVFGRDNRESSTAFDDWLTKSIAAPEAERDLALAEWVKAPHARACHPREEHLIPLMVAAGAAGTDRGVREYRETVMGGVVSGHRFG